MKYAIFQPTPPENAELIKHLIEGKVVYEIGAGSGSWAQAMSKYAKKVVCIENDPILADECESKGLETISDDFTKVDLKEADVIYIFMSMMGNYNLAKKIQKEGWHGTVISGLYPMFLDPTDPPSPDQIIQGEQIPLLIYQL